MRSLLFVPGDSERKQQKGLTSGADVLLVDLEDSVALANKDDARRLTAAFLMATGGEVRQKRYVRVNDLGTGMTDADLLAVMAARPDGIMLPKCNSLSDLEQLCDMLDAHERSSKAEPGSTKIIALITETAAGLLNAGTYGSGHPRLAGMTWGAEDLSADIGAARNKDAGGNWTGVFAHARTMTLLAAAAAGVPAIDTVFVNFRNTEGFATECRAAEADGFTAKMAIHPAQVAPINEAFTPSAEAMAEAQRIVQAFLEAGNPGVVGIEGKMYDRPHLRRAERLLARAMAAGL